MEFLFLLFFLRGFGRWKFNIVFLKDFVFRDLVVGFWIYWRIRKLFFYFLFEWWDRGKERIKGFVIRFCSKK